MAILVLPQLLMLLDGVIQRTPLQRPLLKARK
jgi:hypothetical protein